MESKEELESVSLVRNAKNPSNYDGESLSSTSHCAHSIDSTLESIGGVGRY